MNYDETIKFLYSQLPAYHRIGKAAYKNDLHNSLELDEYLNRPHSKYKTIHIAGTNGKGSVSHMIASILMEAGYKTGLYTSPHLMDFRERIKVNGKMITRKSVTGFIADHSARLYSLKPSFFEMTVAMAFQFFADKGVDVAVIETGLGGRLDSTNIICPVLSVITNIGHDHMDLLGDSLEKIAMEKAGIIKSKIPVIIGETAKETREIFIKYAHERNAEISFADQNWLCELEKFDYDKGKRKYIVRNITSNDTYRGTIPLGGDYQLKNLQTVVQIFRVLMKMFSLEEKSLVDGIGRVVNNTNLMGRWQIIDRNPMVVCDTGHNREGLEYAIKQLDTIPKKKLRIVLGFVNDKDLSTVLPLFPSDASYYFTKASVPRALDEKVLFEEASRFLLQGTFHPDVRSAINAAKMEASSDDLIFIGGSTFIVGDALTDYR